MVCNPIYYSESCSTDYYKSVRNTRAEKIGGASEQAIQKSKGIYALMSCGGESINNPLNAAERSSEWVCEVVNRP